MSSRAVREIWILGILAAAGFSAFLAFYGKAFPTATIDMDTTRESAAALAESMVRKQGFDLDGYRNASVFAVDSQVIAYFERTLGREAANRAFHEQKLPVWNWYVRWYRSRETQAYEAWISPTGEFWGFRRTLPEDQAGPSLPGAEAQRKAEEFLESLGVSMNGLELRDSSTDTLKNRTDHAFKWKKKDFSIGDAEHGIAVGIQGDVIGHFEWYVTAPEEFQRSHTDRQAKGQLLAIASILFTVILFVLALVVFVRQYKLGDLRWRFALTAAIVVFAVGVCATFNFLPLVEASYDTAMDFQVFRAIAVAGGVIGLILSGAFILLCGASGEALTREMHPDSVKPLHDLFSGRVFTPEFAAAVPVGYFAAMIIVGYQTVFYLAGQKYLGVWTDPAAPYDNVLNTAFPFLLPLSVGLMAAISEEFTYRLFAIPLAKKYLKMTALALLIPAIVWAFAHSSYPVYPIYVRGIELTIVGLFFGYLFLRHGIVTCLIAHYSFDALLFSMPLLISDSRYHQVSGAIVILLGAVPLIPASLVWLRRRSSPA